MQYRTSRIRSCLLLRQDIRIIPSSCGYKNPKTSKVPRHHWAIFTHTFSENKYSVPKCKRKCHSRRNSGIIGAHGGVFNLETTDICWEKPSNPPSKKEVHTNDDRGNEGDHGEIHINFAP